MHKKGCLSVCLFALSPPEEKKRGDKAESWREALTCRGGRGERNETDFDRREKEEGKTHKKKEKHVEEPTCDDCPASMHRCECYQSHCHIQKQILQVCTEAFSLYSSYVFFFARLMDCTCWIHLHKVSILVGLIFLSILGSDCSKNSRRLTVRHRRTDGHRNTEHGERKRKKKNFETSYRKEGGSEITKRKRDRSHGR